MEENEILDLVKKLHHSVDDALEEFIKDYAKECKDEDMGVSLADIIHMNEQAMVTVNAVVLKRIKGIMDSISIETGDGTMANVVQSRTVGGALGTIQHRVLPDLLGKGGAIDVVRFMMDHLTGDSVDKSQAEIAIPKNASRSVKEVLEKIRKSVNANGN